MVRHLAALLLPLATLATLACATNQTGASGDLQARLEVENRTSFDMDLYLRSDRGGSVRLGLAPAGESTSFPLAPSLLAGSGAVRFEARPVRGQSQSVFSDPYKVRPGEVIAWSIPPQ